MESVERGVREVRDQARIGSRRAFELQLIVIDFTLMIDKKHYYLSLFYPVSALVINLDAELAETMT